MISAFWKSRTVSRAEQSQRFEQLMRGSHRLAYSYAYRLTGNRSEAEDLVQETFLRAYRFFDRYDEELPFTSWLYRIMANLHIDRARRRSKLKVSSLDQRASGVTATWDMPDDRPGPEQAMLEEVLDERMQLALGSMSSDFRTAVLLADVHGMSYEEIAETMQISVGTVRSRIHRGRKQLRAYLVQTFPDLVTHGGWE